jgi:hypothetical protein
MGLAGGVCLQVLMFLQISPAEEHKGTKAMHGHTEQARQRNRQRCAARPLISDYLCAHTESVISHYLCTHAHTQSDVSRASREATASAQRSASVRNVKAQPCNRDRRPRTMWRKPLPALTPGAILGPKCAATVDCAAGETGCSLAFGQRVRGTRPTHASVAATVGYGRLWSARL